MTHAGLVLCTHAHAGHLDPDTVPAILAASRRAKVVMPMSAAAHAHGLGIAYQRMVTTNADLRVEFLDDRIYAAPSAHPQLDWTPLGALTQTHALLLPGSDLVRFVPAANSSGAARLTELPIAPHAPVAALAG